MPAQILVIEDNPDSLELVSYLLKAFGYSVYAAGTGEEGLEIARTKPIDLVICDIQLPIMDGYQVASALKAETSLMKIPLVAVTAFAMVGDRDKIVAAGFDGYISKPIDPHTFVSQVEQFLLGEQYVSRGESAPDHISAKDPVSISPRMEIAFEASIIRDKSGNGRKLLFVDNVENNRNLVASLLIPLGYEVALAATVKEALDLARLHDFDLIVSDIHMPNEDGFDFIRLVKEDPRLRAIPFVFLSATFNPVPDRETGINLGAIDFLVEPFDPHKLPQQIDEWMRSRGTETIVQPVL